MINLIKWLKNLLLMRLYFSGLILVSVLSGCSVFGVNSVEEAAYEEVLKQGRYELRLYQPLVVASTYVEGNFDQAGDIAFKKLFAYISGENSISGKISMTAPVIANQSETTHSQKIQMTVPVVEQRQDQGWRYMFVLPAAYSIDTAPLPLDDRVKLSVEPEKRVAVIRFSGTRNESIIDAKIIELTNWIAANNLKPVSKPRWAGYNPPWTLPFFRRNEVMIEVI